MMMDECDCPVTDLTPQDRAAKLSEARALAMHAERDRAEAAEAERDRLAVRVAELEREVERKRAGLLDLGTQLGACKAALKELVKAKAQSDYQWGTEAERTAAKKRAWESALAALAGEDDGPS